MRAGPARAGGGSRGQGSAGSRGRSHRARAGVCLGAASAWVPAKEEDDEEAGVGVSAGRWRRGLGWSR